MRNGRCDRCAPSARCSSSDTGISSGYSGSTSTTPTGSVRIEASASPRPAKSSLLSRRLLSGVTTSSVASSMSTTRWPRSRIHRQASGAAFRHRRAHQRFESSPPHRWAAASRDVLAAHVQPRVNTARPHGHAADCRDRHIGALHPKNGLWRDSDIRGQESKP